LAVVLAGASSLGQAVGARPTVCKGPEDLNSWAERWAKPDGAEYQEAGLGLSECLVAEDDLFFRAMLVQPGVFNRWLQGLGSHTFTVFEPLQKPHIVKLKKRMTSIAKRRSSDPRYGDLAKALAAQLAKTLIREVD
jgi:hypothetical protein